MTDEPTPTTDEGTTAFAPPQTEAIAPPTPPDDTPAADAPTDEAHTPTGDRVDASEDPNLGHAFHDQELGVGTGPSQTTEEIDRAATEAQARENG